MRLNYSSIPWKTAAIYALTAGLWIYFSDALVLATAFDHKTQSLLQTYKGWFFVAITTTLLFAILRNHFKMFHTEELERQKSEERLNRIRDQYRQIYEYSGDAILLTTTDGAVLSANPAACGLFTMDESRICSLGRMGLFDLSDPRLPQAHEQWKRAGKFSGVLGMRRGDGSVFPAYISSNVFTDADGMEKITMVIREQTALESISRERSFLSEIVDSSVNEIYVFDAKELHFTYANASALENIGYTMEEIGSLTPVMIKPEFTEERFKEIIKPLEDRQKKTLVFETIHQRKNGSTYPVRVSLQLHRQGFHDYFVAFIFDITEHRKAEDRLKTDEERFRLAMEVSKQWPFEFDIRNNTLKFPPEFALMLGYAPEEVPPTPEFWANNTHPDDQKEFLKVLKEYREGKSSEFHSECRMRTSSGAWLWIEYVGETIEFDPSGKPFRGIGICMDISRRKTMEEKLRASDRIFTHAIDMLCIVGFDGYFKVLNPAWERVLGWSIEELLSKPWITFVHPDDVPAAIMAATSLMDGGHEYQSEERYVCKDGSIRWLSWNSYVYQDEEIFLGVARDVTDRKKMEIALNESEEKYRKLIEHSPDAIFINDDNVITYVNHACVALLKAETKSDIIGKNPLEIFHPDYHTTINDWINKILMEEDPVPLMKGKVICTDGSVFDVETRASPIIIDRKNVIHVVMRDITWRKEAESKLEDQLQELRRWYEGSLGREERLMELKREVNILLAQQGQPPRYAGSPDGNYDA